MNWRSNPVEMTSKRTGAQARKARRAEWLKEQEAKDRESEAKQEENDE
jgi:hypothetical protein